MDPIHLPNEDHAFVVGLQIQGNAKSPRVQLYSSPIALSQTNILSYLVLGHSSDEGNQNDFQRLLNATALLNLETQDRANILSQLQQTFHIDKLGFESGAQAINNNATANSNPNDPNGKKNLPLEQNPSIIVGKKLSPKLYLSYNIGLLQPNNTLKMRYTINPYFSLQTESSNTGNGADLFYTIEK
jgi:translocation and assembly module TamB